jgi:hypothetical protein
MSYLDDCAIAAWMREYPYDDAELAAFALEHTFQGAFLRLRLAWDDFAFDFMFALGFTRTSRGWLK